MLIKCIGRHLAVASAPEAAKIVKTDRNFWNVISIHEVRAVRNVLTGAKRIYYVAFDDAENPCDDGSWVLATKRDIKSILAFADAAPCEPLLVHCRAGLSRSTAVALALLARGARSAKDPVEESVQHLVAIRPRARPNVHVLRLCLEEFLSEKEAKEMAMALVNHPILFKNRFLPE